MNNWTKSQRKATFFTQKEEKATARMQWLLWKLYHNWVASRKTRMRWFLKEADSFGEARCKKSWDRFEKYSSLSLRYVKQVSGKRKDHRLQKYKSNLFISEVPTLWNLRTGPRKRLKDNSHVPDARLGALPKTYTNSKRKTKLHSTRPRKNGYSWLRQQKSRRKESLWWILEPACIRSASETVTLLSWRLWGHRGVRRRWWRPTARCIQEKKQRFSSKNWIYSGRLCFLKIHRQFFHSDNSARIMRKPITGPAVKNHISSEMAREIDCNISNYAHLVVLGLSASSSSTTLSPTSSSSSSQGSVFDFSKYTKNPVLDRSGKYEWGATEKPAA